MCVQAEEVILSDVKNTMSRVLKKLPDQDDKLNKFLKNNIKHLETDKREVVGVFGKTGAGKSSLINAVIGVKDLLPSGSISACTSVMIKVEANMQNPKYEAKIEFITKEAKELSAKLVKYTRSESKVEDAKDVKRCYWPLVKCVTVRVPKNRLLQHVTLVDLPGNGDCNKSRDRMWKKVVGSCSTVWIVTDLNRAASEKEPWEILKESCSLMGNGGECRQIHFICTKSDNFEDSDDQSAAGVRAQILKRNEQAKRKVRAEFSKLKEVKKQFSEEDFKVFTVSSKEFLKKKRLDQDETEIPRLQEFLQDLNEWHSETFNYVSGAHGILSLIQGASSREGTKKGGSAFHRILKNEGNSGPFNGVINAFSLGTEKLMMIKECENVKLQLTFLKTEEEKMKTKLNKLIRERKKTIYSSLTTTIEEKMKPCYDRAKEIRGEGSLKNMRETIEKHVRRSKDVMFVQAKDAMMKQLRNLMLEILEELKSTMQESIELSLKTDGVSIPVLINPVKQLHCVHDVHRLLPELRQQDFLADLCPILGRQSEVNTLVGLGSYWDTERETPLTCFWLHVNRLYATIPFHWKLESSCFCKRLQEMQIADEGVDKESLYCLEDQEIVALIPKVGPRSKFKKRLKLLKEEQNTTDPETSESSVEVCPSTSKTNDKGKRKLDLHGESSQWQSPARKRPQEDILSDVKNTMSCVLDKLPDQDDKLNKFLKKNINDLETDKREVVGVFGRTGAGKSSLINAIIGEQDLLPSGSLSACTSVMIKVEANMRNPKYEAEIEFITKEEWEEELNNFLGDNDDQEKGKDSVEKLSVLYGEEWKNKYPEHLMDEKYFKRIPEFLSSESKILTRDTADDLSADLVKYTRSESKDVKRLYWPLVKCVTVRVPNNRLLQHVTLVDLPGNGDRNKSRDTMWKKFVGSCSTVWIVADINRAAADKESWEILEESCSLMGNGGECQQIHFICTKSDSLGGSDDQSAAGVRAQILELNEQAKRKVKEEFNKLKDVKKQFGEECFKVFTVSSKEFLRKKSLKRNDTEIPELQEFLQELNECHSETFNYVSGAHGILSLIQGASSREGFQADIKTAVSIELEENLSHELDKVSEPMKETLMAFEKCLSEGVETSKSSCEKVLKSVLYPTKKGGAFYGSLKCLVEKGGIHKPKKGKLININMKLSSCLTDSIDEEFKKTFPNEGNSEPFNGVINTFSLGTEKLMTNKEYENVKLQLTFLKTEEEKMKTNLNKLIRERKKTIYSSLTTTIEETMKECYDRAKEIKGEGSLEKMRDTIKNYVDGSKDVMFAQAKDAMVKQLRDLMSEIPAKLKRTMQESIDLSLKTDGVSIPDVSVELEMVKKYYNELKRTTESPDDDATIW
ncbi:hypothetical protein NQZ68_030952 [Dissostichus eleginoides]|nr:hypothetical protein NQZ68_030952 [Dissostichus eleginoides]